MESIDFHGSPMKLTFRLHLACQVGQNLTLNLSGLVFDFERPLGPCQARLEVCVCQTSLNWSL